MYCKPIAIFVLLIAASVCSKAEIEEAIEIENKIDDNHTIENKKFEYSGHLLSELSYSPKVKLPGITSGQGFGEASLRFSWKPHSKVSLFFDSEESYTTSISSFNYKLNQGGVRVQPSEKLEIALGKERQVKAPGIFVNPSDFINSSKTIPG